MTSRVTWAHGVLNAMVAPRSGRLVVAPPGSGGFMWDVFPGYPCWGYTQNTVTAHEALARPILTWLTGKTSGMSVLSYIYAGGAPSCGPLGFGRFITRSDNVGGRFDDALGNVYGWGPWASSVGLSGSYTATGGTSSGGQGGWTTHDWEGFDPYNYDVVCLYTQVSSGNYDEIDAYLASGGSIIACLQDSSTWARYGIVGSSGFQSGGAPPDYLGQPFACAPFGAGTFQYGIYSSSNLTLGTNVMGGSVHAYGTSSNQLALWSA